MNLPGRIPLIMTTLGACAMLLQVTALREYLAAFSGSELDLGITLSVWLLAAGSGSLAARRIHSPRALGLSVLLAGLLSPPLFSLIPHIRPLLALETGETVPLHGTVLMTMLLLAPVGALVGMHFTLAVRTLTNSGPRAFLLEAVGAFLAGTAYTFLLAGNAASSVVVAVVSAAYCVLASGLLERRSLALLVIVPFLASVGISRSLPAAYGERQLMSRTESRYGTIEVFQARGQVNVFAGGKLQYAYPDPQADETRALLLLALHPRPTSVLVAGGSPGAALAFLRDPGITVDLIELDPELLRVSSTLLTPEDREAAMRGRVRFLADDARRYGKQLPGPRYDLIVLNLPEPATANLNRLYTVEFFREAKRVLNGRGVLTLNLPASFGYVGKRMQEANGSIVASLQNVFRHVALSSEEYGVAAASDGPIDTAPALLQHRLRERTVRFDHVYPTLLDDAFDPRKAELHRQRLAAVTTLNSDARPIAYLNNLMLWAEMQRSGTLQFLIDNGRTVAVSAAAIVVLAGIAAGVRRRGVSYSVFAAGLVSMASSLVVLLAYQSAFGYVYERVGLLTAAFMAGSAAGAYAVRDRPRPLALLRLVEGAGVALLLLAPLFLRTEAFYVALMALLGASGGAVYVAAVSCGGAEDAAARAGRLYALDLAGAFLGALLCAIVLVPLFGVLNTLLGMVLFKMLSLTILVLAGNEQS